MQEIPKKFSTHTVGIAAAIIEKGGKILLVKENRPHLPGHAKWHHPAGWIDKGENLIDAVIREAKEETGFEFTPTYLIGIYSLYREDFNLHPIKFIFAGTVPDMPSDSFNPDEILEIKFFFLKKSTTWTTKCFSMLMRSKLSKIIFPERSIHWK